MADEHGKVKDLGERIDNLTEELNRQIEVEMPAVLQRIREIKELLAEREAATSSEEEREIRRAV